MAQAESFLTQLEHLRRISTTSRVARDTTDINRVAVANMEPNPTQSRITHETARTTRITASPISGIPDALPEDRLETNEGNDPRHEEWTRRVQFFRRPSGRFLVQLSLPLQSTQSTQTEGRLELVAPLPPQLVAIPLFATPQPFGMPPSRSGHTGWSGPHNHQPRFNRRSGRSSRRGRWFGAGFWGPRPY